ncbi:YjhX family toxin [Arvimicrobium flavum]|uniref:YjhX family toxin n=1 Tax=Arvimicrobium flavum TaxID=3393320 RepID=UPI00237BE64B|nr:YjhX family toxin [Mesorhizobium shangrilense]
MNVSRLEQRILHLLARGGRIDLEKNDDGKLEAVHCVTREGWRHAALDIELFRKLKRKRAIASSQGGPYRITRQGLLLVRPQPDNR